MEKKLIGEVPREKEEWKYFNLIGLLVSLLASCFALVLGFWLHWR